MRRLSVSALVLAAALWVAGPAAAQSINLGTGLSPTGVALADGTSDPFWVTWVGGANFTAAKVLGDGFNTPCGCGILPNALSGKWINATGVIQSSWTIYDTIYTRRTFNLTGYDLSTVSLSGSWSVMDGLIGMYLNGNLIGGTSYPYPPNANWQLLHAFSVAGASNFLAGTNELEFRTTTVNGIYDGVLLENASVDGAMSTVPEPASIVLLASGLAGISFVGRRRKASRDTTSAAA